MPNILSIPNSSTIFFSSDTAGASTSPALTGNAVSLAHNGSAGLTISSLNTSSLSRLQINGANGSLFAVTDAVTGTVFTVNDASGLPIVSVDTGLNDVVTIGTYGSNALVVRNNQVGVGTTTPNVAALLDITSTTKGFLPPRMTSTQRDAIASAPASLIVYNTTDNAISLHNGTAWGNVLTTHSASFTSATLAAAVSDETGSGSLVFGTSPSLTSPTIDTSATFNATTYTYGAGAAVAHSSALGVVDSRVASLFTSHFHFQQDNYLGRWLTASGNNAFNWIGVGTATRWSDVPFQAAGFVGGVSLMTNNNAFFYYMTSTAAASISNFNGVVFDHVFSTVNTSIANENIFVGIRNTGSETVETGRRGLWYEAGVDTNWQLLHETSDGVKTKIDTGKPVALNQVVRVTLKFVSATQTDMIITTSTSTTPATSSATTGFSCTGGVGLGFGLRSTTAANRFILPMRSILAWTPSTL